MKEYKVDITKEIIPPSKKEFRHFLFMKFETRASRKQRYAWVDYYDKYCDDCVTLMAKGARVK